MSVTPTPAAMPAMERRHDFAALPAEIRTLVEALEAADGEARAVADGLDERAGTWRPDPASWSVAHCLDHLATANHVYLVPLREAADEARRRGWLRRDPARPGLIGRSFIATLEPGFRFKLKAPRKIRPQPAPGLAASLHAFLLSQDDVRRFALDNADLDLNRARFRNPFVRGLRFSLATGLHVVETHDRRHLAQAWAIRRHPGFPSASPTQAEGTGAR